MGRTTTIMGEAVAVEEAEAIVTIIAMRVQLSVQ
jgi:hypothetical protein